MARTTYKDRQNAALMILKYFFVESVSNNVTNKNIYRTCIYYILHFVYLSSKTQTATFFKAMKYYVCTMKIESISSLEKYRVNW